jgi:hypothetical protein
MLAPPVLALILTVLVSPASAQEDAVPLVTGRCAERDRFVRRRIALVVAAERHRRAGRLDRAVAVLEKILGIEEEFWGEVHEETARTHGRLAFVHAQRDDLAAVRRHRERRLSILEERLGPDHAETIDARLDVEDLAILERLEPDGRRALREAEARNDAAVWRYEAGEIDEAIS